MIDDVEIPFAILVYSGFILHTGLYDNPGLNLEFFT